MKKLLLVCALFLAVPALFAQGYSPLYEYGLFRDTTRVELYGGMVLPRDGWKDRSSDTDFGKMGWSAGIGFQRNLVNWFSLGLDANYAQLGDTDKAGDKSYYRTGIATGLVTGRISFFTSRPTRLYIPFGAGIGHTFARHQKADHSHETVSGTDWAHMVGLGLEFDMDESMIFGLEGRMYRVTTRDDFKATFNKDHIYYLDIMLKLGFRF